MFCAESILTCRHVPSPLAARGAVRESPYPAQNAKTSYFWEIRDFSKGRFSCRPRRCSRSCLRRGCNADQTDQTAQSLRLRTAALNDTQRLFFRCGDERQRDNKPVPAIGLNCLSLLKCPGERECAASSGECELQWGHTNTEWTVTHPHPAQPTAAQPRLIASVRSDSAGFAITPI